MAEGGGGALRELLAAFSISVDDHELEEGTEKIEGFVGKLQAVGKIVAEAFIVDQAKEFFETQIEGAAHMQDLSDRLGVSASNLGLFARVAKGAGVDADGAAHTLAKLNMTLGEAMLKGGEGAQTFAALGVEFKDAHGQARPLMDVVEDVSEGLAKLPNQQERAAYAMRLFGREGRALLPILSQGKEKLREQFEEMKALGSGLGDTYPAEAKKAREESEKFGFAIASIKSRITSAALPAIMWLLEGMTKVGVFFLDLTKKSYVIQTALIALASVMSLKLVGSLGSILKVLGVLQPTLSATVAKMLALAWPVVLVAALYLAFDELFTLMKGGDTILGRLLDSFLGLGTGAKVGLYLNAVWEDLIDTLGDFGAIMFNVVLVAVNAVADSLIAIGRAVAALAHGDFSGVGKAFTEGFKDIGPMVDEAKKAALDIVSPKEGKSAKVSRLLDNGVDPQQLLQQINAPNSGGLAGANPAYEKVDTSQDAAEPLDRMLKSYSAAKRAKATAQAKGQASVPAVATAYKQVPSTNAGGAPAGAPTVNQTNNYTTTVHTSSDNPKAVGEAVGQGVATTQQKANNNAYKAVVSQ